MEKRIFDLSAQGTPLYHFWSSYIGLAHSLSYWVFTDIFEEEGPAPEAFHGGFGLQTIHGIPKPSYHAYSMLHQLGDTLLEKGEDYIITKDDAGRLRGLFYHYPEEVPSALPMSVYPDHDSAEKVQNTGTAMPPGCGRKWAARQTCPPNSAAFLRPTPLP